MKNYRFIQQHATVPIIVFLLTGLLAIGSACCEESPATILSTKVICKQENRYIGWPSLAKTSEGELLAVFSGDRDLHICPWGKVQMIRSSDNGETWSEPVTIGNSPLDDRDAGIIETNNGVLVVNWFSSIAFMRDNLRPTSVVETWARHKEKVTPELKAQWLGNWVKCSTDGGETWGQFIDGIVSAPHGPNLLSDGRLLCVGKNKKVGDPNVPAPPDGQFFAAVESRDDGQNWKIIGYIPPADNMEPGEDAIHEAHVVECASGRLVAMFRYHGTPSQYYLWQSESDDGGKTWTTMHPTAIWGYPPHLLRLSNNWLLVTYGRRIEPYGIRACISRDEGETWDVANEMTISDPIDYAIGIDLGYPASVQLDDGSLYTVYYRNEEYKGKPLLVGTHWRLNAGQD